MDEINKGDILTFPQGIWATVIRKRKNYAPRIKNFMFGYFFYGAPVKSPFYKKEKLISEEELCFGSYRVLAEEMGLFCLENIDRVEPRYILVEKTTLANTPSEKKSMNQF